MSKDRQKMGACRAAAMVVAVAALGCVSVLGAAQTADAAAGSYVETVTFSKQYAPDAAIENLISGDIHMYYESVSGADAQKIRDAGHDLYESTSGTTYLLEVNPTDNHTNGFNPFAYQGVRFAVNYMVDREHMVSNLFASGAPMYSALPPNHHDYLLVYKYLESLGFSYDLEKAAGLIEESLVPAGAVRSPDDGRWYYNGEQITVKVFVRSDDQVRNEIGRGIIDALERLGFGVEVREGNLSEAFEVVYGTDPAAQEWSLYTGAVINYGYTRYDNSLLGAYYAPVFGGMPGHNVPKYWNYEHDRLDRLAQDLVNERYSSFEERARWIQEANRLGVSESVVVPLGMSYDNVPVRNDVTGVVDSKIYGAANRYTALTAQIPEPEKDLEIGVRHVVQSSWNPVGGFRDTYSDNAWSLLRDVAFVNDPHTLDLIDSRSMVVSVETAGRDGKIQIPPGAVAWGAGGTWGAPNATEATSKVTFNIKFSNWHNGQPMDVNDLLYPVVFNQIHRDPGREYPDEELKMRDMYATLSGGPHLKGIRVTDANTVEAYIDYWHPNKIRIALAASLWPQMPWEVYHAMDMAVHRGTADWWRNTASAYSGNWVDVLDPADAGMIRMYLEMAKERESGDHIPDFIYMNRTSGYVNERYDATLAWIADRGHAAISNGPFYLSGPIVRDNATGDIVNMTITQFDDPTYPFGPEKWESFAMFEPLSGDVVVGSLAPTSGNAHRYGAEIRAAVDIAVSDFNEYVEARGQDWRLAPRSLDTATSPDVALAHLERLRQDGTNLVLGPSIDIMTRDMVSYADRNDMLLISCCSSAPSLAIPDDSLFRMLPDQRVHAGAIVDLLEHQNVGIRHIVPVGIDAAWASELLEAAEALFEAGGGTSSDIIMYENPLRDGLAGSTESASGQGEAVGLDDAAGMLAAEVERAVGQHGAVNVAVLYVGFGEGPEFLKAASEHDILDNVRWFGADQNTAHPNIADDPASADFARTVKFTAVQPAAHELVRDFYIQEEIERRLHGLGVQNSTYSKYAYDSVWLMGLSILNAPNSTSAGVVSVLPSIAALYVGASGSTAFNDNGDLDADDPAYRYVSWSVSDEAPRWGQYQPDNDMRPAANICR